MSKVTIFFLILGTLGTFAYGSALIFPGLSISTSIDTTQVQEAPLINIFSKWLVDTLTTKITEISSHFKLKIRVIKFLTSLYTNENLVLFRNLTEYAVRIGTITLRVLPTSVEDPNYWWISSLVEFFNNINVGNGGLFEQFLGPISTDSVSTDDSTGSHSEKVEILTDPPVNFNEPTKESDDNNETSQPKATVDDVFSDSETKANEELLSSYEGRIMTLNKLINIKRK